MDKDSGELVKFYHEIYSTAVKIKRENRSYSEVSFLVIDVDVINKKLSCLYNIWVSFPFSILRWLYLGSNMFSKTFYASYAAEVLRITRTTTDFAKFK